MKKSPDIRYLYDMKKLLYDKAWFKTAPNLELYYMYRGEKRNGELRYDITIIPPKMLGSEFNKTLGHDHSKKFGEVYTVLDGEVIYLIQKTKKDRVLDVYAVKAKRGESIIIPPHYGHTTINPTKKIIKEANWLSENCKNLYSNFKRMQGACYYYTKSGWIKNKKYSKVPKLRFEKSLKSIPKDLNFLKG
jgi:glucose-6-phosphate isomerase